MDPIIIVILIAAGAIGMWLYMQWAKNQSSNSSPPTSASSTASSSDEMPSTHELEDGDGD